VVTGFYLELVPLSDQRCSPLTLDKLNKTVFMHDNFQLIVDYASDVAVPGNARK